MYCTNLIVTQWRHLSSWNLVNIVSCYGLLPEGTKSLPEPMLTNSLRPSDAIWWWHRSLSTLALTELTEDNFSGNAKDISHWGEFENYKIKITGSSPRGRCTNHQWGLVLFTWLLKIYLEDYHLDITAASIRVQLVTHWPLGDLNKILDK